ncbi:hypothetical protein BVZ57_00539C, partial [Haemophilus influenzae]
LHSPHKKWIMY